MQTILVCDDDKEIVEAIEIYLQQEGYHILKAYDGEEALEILKENEVHLLIMDVMMPVMDGLEATKAIRELEREDAKKIPIIAMTANAFEEDKKKALEAGMNAHIAKPISIDAIMEVLDQIFDRRK